MYDYPPDHSPRPDSMGERLQQERERLGLSQKQLAQQMGYKSASKIGWAESPADTFLTCFKCKDLVRMAQLRIDLQYIMTGRRSILLNEAEATLLDNYRASSPTNKDHLEAVSTALAQSELDISGQPCKAVGLAGA